MTTRYVRTIVDGAVGKLVIDRQGALNALNADVLAELISGVTELTEEPGVRVIVITGAGEKSFVAGADISEFVGARPADAMKIAARFKRVAEALVQCPKPVIASVNGYCLGGGLELALACDFRIASTSAVFGLPEIKLGILPGGGGTVRLTKIAGSSVARMMAMTGEPIDAARASGLGLLISIHPLAELADATDKLARHLADLPSFALAQLKSSLNTAIDADVESPCQTEIKAFAVCYSTEDQAEGAAAFLEKRKPVFKGR
jgi:enoyl-CoA hydratase